VVWDSWFRKKPPAILADCSWFRKNKYKRKSFLRIEKLFVENDIAKYVPKLSFEFRSYISLLGYFGKKHISAK